LIAIVLAIAVAGANARIVLGDQTWNDVAYHTLIAPSRLAAAEAIHAGRLPGWWEGTSLGVPLLAEPSHGALYPPLWLATSPRALDLLTLLHLWWAALGIAVWARRSRASEPAALVAGLLLATSGIAASMALRGALPALAHLPWLGVLATQLGAARARDERVRTAVAIALLLGLVGLAGVLGALVEALVLVVALAASRRTLATLALAIAAGLALAAVQWGPALALLLDGSAVGSAGVASLPLARLIELIVPASFGADDPGRALAGVAGGSAWAPSLHAGVPLLALAAVRPPARRMLAVLGAAAGFALISGRGGWPPWLGAPELHVAAFVFVLAPRVGPGVDDLIGSPASRGIAGSIASRRRALRALAAGVGCLAISLVALLVLGRRADGGDAAIERALIHGGLAVVAVLAAAALARWRPATTERRDALPRAAIILALLVLPQISSLAAIAPVIDRAVVEEPPPFAAAVYRDAEGPAPARVFRPEHLIERPRAVRPDVYVPRQRRETREEPGLATALATFAGGSGWRWGIAVARSEDPARHVDHDRAWLASAREGGALLDRHGIAYAILPATLIVPRGLRELSRRGDWSLVALEVAPPAAVLRGWVWAGDADEALSRLYPAGGGAGVPRGTAVLHGAGTSTLDGGPPLPCVIARWEPGDIALACTSDVAGYAVVASSPAPGWRVWIDGVPADAYVADVLRRAVALPAGSHRVTWSYAAPGLGVGLVAAGAAAVVLLVLGVGYGRARRSSESASASASRERSASDSR
jgi:hypothetical protein